MNPQLLSYSMSYKTLSRLNHTGGDVRFSRAQSYLSKKFFLSAARSKTRYEICDLRGSLFFKIIAYYEQFDIYPFRIKRGDIKS